MPTVPRRRVAQTPLQALDLPPRNPNAPAAAFGSEQARANAGIGLGIQQLGNVLIQGASRLKRVEDATARVTDIDNFRTTMREAFLEEQQEGSDFADTEALRSFAQTANDTMEGLLGKHAGSTTSRGVLGQMLIRERARFTDAAVSRSVVSRKNKITTQLQDSFSQQAATASQAPDTIESLFQEIDERVDNFQEVFTPDELETRRKAGKEQVATAALDTLFALGDTTAARKSLEASTPFLSPNTARSFRNRLIVFEATQDRKQAETASRNTRLQAMGVDLEKLPLRAKLALEGVNLPSGPTPKVTLSDKIVEFEAAVGRKATEQEIQEMQNIDITEGGDDPVFGRGSKGRAAARLAVDAVDFAEGSLTPQEDRLFLQSVALMAQRDPVTGELGIITPDIQAALRVRGFDPERLGSSADPEAVLGLLQPEPQTQAAAAAPQGPVQESVQVPPSPPVGGSVSQGFDPPITTELQREEVVEQPIRRVGESADIGGQQGSTIEAAPLDSTGQAGLVSSKLNQFVDQTRSFESTGGMFAPDAPEPEIQLFDSVDKLTGPISGLKSSVAGTAFIGKLFQSPDIIKARRFMKQVKLDLATALQNSPRFAEGERQQILEALDLESKFFGEPEAFKQELTALDDFLRFKEESLRNDIEKGTTTRTERIQTTAALNVLTRVRKVLGVPPIMRSKDEVNLAIQDGTLRPGDSFRVPDGRIKFVPAPQGQ